jgi:hypothetical protein
MSEEPAEDTAQAEEPARRAPVRTEGETAVDDAIGASEDPA